MKEYNYTNDMGYHKKLVVYDEKNGKFPVMLWSMDTGDLCGSGKMTKKELDDYLKHYNIKG